MRRVILSTVLLLVIGNTLAWAAMANTSRHATLSSDKPDYHPGETVILTGTGWAPNEVVTVLMTVDPATHEPVTLSLTADVSGNFKNSDYVVQPSDFGVTFHARATGERGDAAEPLTFTDGIGTPVGIGNNGYSSQSNSSLPVSVTSAVAVNNTVIVAIVLYTNNHSFTVTVTDSGGNTYSNNADVTDSADTRTIVFSAPVTTALTTSNTITVSFTHSVQYINVSAFSVSGLLTASPVDKTATSTGTSTSASVGPTATTTQAGELLIGAFGLDIASNGSPTFTPGTNYSALPTNVISGSWGIYPEYQIVSVTGAYSASGTFGGSGGVADWAAALVTYKATPTGRKGQTILGQLNSNGSDGTNMQKDTFNGGTSSLTPPEADDRPFAEVGSEQASIRNPKSLQTER